MTSGWSSYSWKLLNPFQKGQYCATWTIPKRGRQQCSSSQNCHTVQRLITWGVLLLPLEGFPAATLFFFLVEVSGSFVYPATGIFWRFLRSKISTTFVWTRPPMHFRHQWLLLTHKSRESMPHLQFHANNGSLRKTSWICYRKVLLDSKSFLFPGIFEIVIFIQNLGGFDKKAWSKEVKQNTRSSTRLEHLRLWFCWRRDSGIRGKRGIKHVNYQQHFFLKNIP